MTQPAVQLGAGAPGLPPNGAAISARIARGDRLALGEFYEAWFDRLYATARSLTGRDESFCLDVVQETMLRVSKSMKAMERDEDVARWMMRVVHTTALDLLRKEARMAARHRRVGAKRGGSYGIENEERAERIKWLRGQLAELPAEDGGMLWLRFGAGRTLAAVGAAAGISGHAAHGRLRRVLARLRNTGTSEDLP